MSRIFVSDANIILDIESVAAAVVILYRWLLQSMYFIEYLIDYRISCILRTPFMQALGA